MSRVKLAQRRYQPVAGQLRTSFQSAQQSCSSSSSSSSSPSTSPVPSAPLSCFHRDSGGPKKKRVVFADAVGLPLTAVRLFTTETTSPPSTPPMDIPPSKPQQPPSTKPPGNKLRLGFPQPMLDFNVFLARLREMRVQLLSCSVSEHSLSGKVCVCHVGFEKAVHIRVTFDSWRSHQDVPCVLLQQQRHGGSDIEVFAFDLSLPQNVDPKEGIEFCLSSRPGPGATPYWDDNRGQKYKVHAEKDESYLNHFYPSHSKVRQLAWPTHAAQSPQKDLQHLQKSLSSRVGAEWKALCSAKYTLCN